MLTKEDAQANLDKMIRARDEALFSFHSLKGAVAAWQDIILSYEDDETQPEEATPESHANQ